MLFYRFFFGIVFLTGLTSLVYQTCWQRYFGFLLGGDSVSTTLTLTIFLSFLSLGYYLAGRFSEKFRGKEIVIYGVAEIIIGCWALAFPFFVDAADGLLGIGFFQGFFGGLVLSVLLMALPATLMGSTLPFLTQGLSFDFALAGRVHASIYGVNTIGACVGAYLAGFWLVNALGLSTSLYITGALNVLGGGLSLYLANRISPQTQEIDLESANASDEQADVSVMWVYLVAACSGYFLIACEILLIRLFSQFTDGSSYAYPTIVTSFIGAIGIGAAVSGRLMKHALKLYPILPFIALFFWGGVFLLFSQLSYHDYLLKHFVINAFDDFLLLPTLRLVWMFGLILIPLGLTSMLLPFSFHFIKSKQVSLGQTTGWLYTVSTIATIAGGVLGGHLLFYFMNEQALLVLLICVLFVMGYAASRAVKQIQVPYVVLGAVVTIVSAIGVMNSFSARDLALSFYYQVPEKGSDTIAGEEQARNWLWNWFNYDEVVDKASVPSGYVAVLGGEGGQFGKKRMITINSRSNSGTEGSDYEGNALLSLLPYALTESPKRVLVIGVGTGVTIGAIAAQQEVEEVVVCEINKGVIDFIPHFDYANFSLSLNKKVTVLHQDALKYLKRTDKQFDVVVSIPSNFWVAGVENLVTPEFYRAVSEKLAPGGHFVQWVPDYEFSEKAFTTVTRSFTSGFGPATLWRLSQDDLVLIHKKPGEANSDFLSDRLEEELFVEVLGQVSNMSPLELVGSQIAREDVVQKIASLGEVHDLNNPRLAKLVFQALYNLDPEYSAEEFLKNL